MRLTPMPQDVVYQHNATADDNPIRSRILEYNKMSNIEQKENIENIPQDETSPYGKKTFYATSIGFSLYVGAIFSLEGLQSSINIKDDLGPKSIFLCFLFSLFGIFTTACALKRYGEKYTLITGELISVLFTIANFYPRWYTMFPTAIIDALTSANWTWSASAVVISKVASAKANKSGKLISVESQKHFGIYLGIIALGQVLTNVITKLILTYVKFDLRNFMVNNFTSSNASSYMEETSYNNSIENCGSRDCPIEYAFGPSKNLVMYEPDRSAFYVLLTVYALMQICAATIHCVVLPPRTEDFEVKDVNGNTPSDKMLLLKKKKPESVFSPIKAVFLHACSPEGLVVFPVCLLYGLTMTFAWSELNRAYVSCVVGVDQVGSGSALIDFFSFLTSLTISKCSSRYGLTYIMIFALFYDLTYYISILLWIPTQSTTYLSYVFASTFGVIHATRRNTAYVIASSSSEDQEIGFSTLCIGLSIGSMLTYAWSTALCVYIKLYIMMGFVVIASGIWLLSSFFRSKK